MIVVDACGNADTCTTIVTIGENPAIGVAKRAVSVIDNPNGSGTVVYEFNIENFGNVDLDSLQLIDSLFNIFPAPCAIDVLSITSSDFLVNSNFNGLTDLNLLLGSDNILSGEKGSILLEINVFDCGGNNGPFFNQAFVSALSPGGDTIIDASVDGADPDPNGDNVPVEMSPTPVTFQEVTAVGLSKNVVFAQINPDGSFDVSYEFVIENFSLQQLDSIQVEDNFLQVVHL
jgi:hypothetical protein